MAHHAAAEGSDGAVFYWRLQYTQGDVDPAEGVDYAWLTKDEAADRLGGRESDMGKLVREMCGPFP